MSQLAQKASLFTDIVTAAVANVTNFFTGNKVFTLFTEMLLLATKSENLGPAGPECFSWKSSPVGYI